MDEYVLEIENEDGSEEIIELDYDKVKTEDGKIYGLDDSVLIGDLIFETNYSNNIIVILIALKKTQPSIDLLDDLVHGNKLLNVELIGRVHILFDKTVNTLIEWGSDTNDLASYKTKQLFKELMKNLNTLNEKFEFIETLEREYIMDFIEQGLTNIGLNEDQFLAELDVIRMW